MSFRPHIASREKKTPDLRTSLPLLQQRLLDWIVVGLGHGARLDTAARCPPLY
ncbi:unnamed protein product [Staurois parvus]|uniref:Uncharacterized protein n=1 Tax=Staurois parvus TaxID=386267 RepID=A0ABN9AND7_9NEOB|nr:unnamed protein product [Staurois parvus]